MSMLANEWAGRNVPVVLITLGDSSSDFYKLDSRIERIGLGLVARSSNWITGAIWNCRRIAAIRRVLRLTKPDVLISFMTSTNILSVLACKALDLPCLVSEHTSTAHTPLRGLWGLAFTYVYRHADGIVALTDRTANWLRYRFPRTPIHVIPNPVAIEESRDDAEQAANLLRLFSGRHVVLGMGRLTPEKGFDLLIRAFAQVAPQHPDWSLVILGEGSERKNLEQQIDSLNLRERIHLLGLVQYPQIALRRSAVFVLSSRFEGMPMALLEAMACGLACASFDCCTGPAEIIVNETSGLLVTPGDVQELAKAMLRLIADPNLRARLGAAARYVLRDYGLNAVVQRWDALISTVMATSDSSLEASNDRDVSDAA